MTPAQTRLLQRLIEADRRYQARRHRGLACHPDERGIEVGLLVSGVHRSTADSLVDAGLAEMVKTERNNSNWIFLGRLAPLDNADEE